MDLVVAIEAYVLNVKMVAQLTAFIMYIFQINGTRSFIFSFVGVVEGKHLLL
jgi:hypothetical protein